LRVCSSMPLAPSTSITALSAAARVLFARVKTPCNRSPGEAERPARQQRYLMQGEGRAACMGKALEKCVAQNTHLLC
jgi:hypothetical protein